MNVVGDFETANRDGISVKDVGAEAYAQHPATEVLCLVLKFLGPQITGTLTWKPGDDEDALAAYARNPDIIFEAHNSFFEQMIWKHIMVPRYGFPEIPDHRWSCSMAKALYAGFPGGLEKAADVAHLEQQKDMVGSKLTISLSKPMTKKAQKEKGLVYSPSHFDRSPETLARVIQYCTQDCTVEAELAEVAGELSPYEHAVWHWDQVINRRGVRLDTQFIQAAIRVVAEASRELTTEFVATTGGIEPGQLARLGEWCARQGVTIESFDKAHMAALGIGGADNDDETDTGTVGSVPELPENVQRMLVIRAMLGSSSVKKLPRMLQCVGSDGRSRGLVQYHGAGTGRWAGRLWQPHNLPRGLITIRNDKGKDVPPDPKLLYRAIMTGDHNWVRELFGDAIKAVATNLRSAVIPDPGHMLVDGDFSGIEMRTVLGIAGQHDKTDMLAAKHDVYLDMACDIYGVPKGSLTKDDVEKRTIGKNTVLGCGFQMGGDTFHTKYCPHMPQEFADEVVDAYRKKWAPKVPKLWKALQEAALEAVINRGRVETVYGIAYEYVQKGNHKWLLCHLPDGQIQRYYDPVLSQRRMPWDNEDVRLGWSYMAWKDGRWKSMHAYGGLLTENAVQKIARGFLVEAIIRLDTNGFPVVLTVHDSILAEPLSAHADWETYKQIMIEPTRTSTQYRIPIATEGFVDDRWRK